MLCWCWRWGHPSRRWTWQRRWRHGEPGGGVLGGCQATSRLGLGSIDLPLTHLCLTHPHLYRSLGANDFQVFWNVTVPNIKWGLLYGIILTNAVSAPCWGGREGGVWLAMLHC